MDRTRLQFRRQYYLFEEVYRALKHVSRVKTPERFQESRFAPKREICAPKIRTGSPAPRWETVVDLAGAAEEVWMCEIRLEVRLALRELVWGGVYGGASP